MQEKKESEAQEDLDICTKAGLFVADIVNQVSEDDGDFNTDTRLIAAYRLSNVIDRLEVLRMYSDFLGNEAFPDYNSFTAPFDHFVNEYNENVENVRARLKEIDMEIERLKAALEDATNAGNTEEIISYTDALEISKKSKEYLLPALKKQEGKDALPNGAVKDAWADVCTLSDAA